MKLETEFIILSGACAFLIGLLVTLKKIGLIHFDKSTLESQQKLASNHDDIQTSQAIHISQVYRQLSDINNNIGAFKTRFTSLEKRLDNIENTTQCNTELTNGLVKTINDIQSEYHDIKQQNIAVKSDYKDVKNCLATLMKQQSNKK